MDDHDRGCKGREYVCSCGYDDEVEAKLARYEKALLFAEGAIRETLEENGHLADGDNCTLYKLKEAIKAIDEARNALGEE